MTASPAPKKPIAPPKGTRDLYPEDALRRRYVQQVWRDASIRCGFEEIAGPTFETADLYAVKSGEGILGELFQAYSGKSPDEVEQVRESGRAPYALRPEFTPTLARMYAARSGSLPKPCKWFTAGPYFRAERPQRGRLREFEQWNVDVIGLPGDLAPDDEAIPEAKAWMDAECIECCVHALGVLGLDAESCRCRLNHRESVTEWLGAQGVGEARLAEAFALLDRLPKLSEPEARSQAAALGLNADVLAVVREGARGLDGHWSEGASVSIKHLGPVVGALTRSRVSAWTDFDMSIVRGLAYYTGTVFEMIAEGERAVAGGGRYDNLIELMGGPPTPAVGFAMGDVVLSLLLEDAGLLPEGGDLADAVSRTPASVRPDVFVVSGASKDSPDEEAILLASLVLRLSADLRRGVESDPWNQRHGKPWDPDRYAPGSPAEGGGVQPLHARVSYKSTRNLKKLLSDGEKQRARYAAVVHAEDRVQVRDLDARRELTPADVPGMPDSAAEFSVDPSSPMYVGRAVQVL
ncbi:MAG: ATP phosphoribosyltransferase regulatory subunit [Phycisphaerales bacterium]